jgi:hypothetical protein
VQDAARALHRDRARCVCDRTPREPSDRLRMVANMRLLPNVRRSRRSPGMSIGEWVITSEARDLARGTPKVRDPSLRSDDLATNQSRRCEGSPSATTTPTQGVVTDVRRAFHSNVVGVPARSVTAVPGRRGEDSPRAARANCVPSPLHMTRKVTSPLVAEFAKR